MRKDAGSFSLQAFGFLVMFTPILCAQTITGVANERQYSGQATFTVLEEAGYDTTATLNGVPVPVGTPYRVTRMDFYELVALQTPNSGGTTTRKSVRFIVISENRANPERGLIE